MDLWAYMFCAFLWGLYAVRRQVKLHGWSWWRVPLVGMLNAAFCPICMVFAIVRGE